MSFRGQVGELFFLDDENKGHFWIVLTPPDELQLVAIFNFTGREHGEERTIWIQPSECTYLTKPSTLRFSQTRLLKREKLEKIANGKDFICEMELVHRIVTAAFGSEFIPLKCQRYIEKQYPELFKKYCQDKGIPYTTIEND